MILIFRKSKKFLGIEFSKMWFITPHCPREELKKLAKSKFLTSGKLPFEMRNKNKFL